LAAALAAALAIGYQDEEPIALAALAALAVWVSWVEFV
jgi:hypothetical protein